MQKLYRKDSTGKIRSWSIEVIHHEDKSELRVVHGVESGALVTSVDFVTKGKNIGRSNETSREKQAELEAQSKWLKQKKDGYVEDLQDAKDGKVDESVIKGGIEVTTAKSYDEHDDKVEFPCFVQPKLDGIRATIIKDGDSVTIWSRERNRFVTCPHLEDIIRDSIQGNIILDGELYNHIYSDNFNKIVSLVKKGKITDETLELEFHAFDIVVPNTSFKDRRVILENIITQIENKKIKIVENTAVGSHDEIMLMFKSYREKGYEGVMIRNAEAPYRHCRTTDLLKVKDFQDAEFEIIGYEEGRGKYIGKIANFIVKVSETVTAKAKVKCTHERAKELFENHSLWKGKKVTVRFNGYTPDGSLRHPRAIEIRDYE